MGDWFMQLPRVPSMGGVRTRRSSYGDGLSMPDADDDELGPLASDSPLRHGRTLAGSLWWTISSVALVAALMSASMPLWLQLVAAAEAYASLRRAVIWWVSGDAADGPPKGHVSTERRPAERRAVPGEGVFVAARHLCIGTGRSERTDASYRVGTGASPE